MNESPHRRHAGWRMACLAVLLGGDVRLQLRLETFNLFNHPNLNWPITNLSDPNFGKIRGKSHSPRRVQLGIRLMF